MFLHLGADFVINEADIVGIFDMDSSSASSHTRAFFKACQQQGRVVEASDELPKSVVVCTGRAGTIAYISQLSTATLKKRLQGSAGIK